MSIGKLYRVGIVGEKNYQPAIRDSWEGQSIRICHELENPYDEKALKVLNSDGACIGYISREHWLRRAIHKEGRGVAGIIYRISDGGTGKNFGVVIQVTLTDDQVPQVIFDRPRPEKTLPPPEKVDRPPNFEAVTRPKMSSAQRRAAAMAVPPADGQPPQRKRGFLARLFNR